MFNKLRVSTKIIIPILIILTLGNIITSYVTTSKMHNLAKHNTKESLQMLTDSIFITLRNAMNTGDPATIKQAENTSRDNIKGLTALVVSKSKNTIEMYSPEEKFTKDADVLTAFSTKKELVKELHKNDSHFLRVLRPMIATQECLMCHANEQVGNVIGVIDLTFSLNESDKMINDTLTSILSIIVILIIMTIIVVLFVAKKATQPLNELKDELSIFFSFLAHERDTIQPFKVHSMDEIGEITVALNENIERTIKGLHQDAEAIKQSSMVCETAAKGNLSVKIEAKAHNPEINNLVNIVNSLLSSLIYNISRVLDILDKYSKDDYLARLESKGRTTGEIKLLFNQVNILGDTLTALSTKNLQNGKALQQTSDIFAKNVQQLAKSSNEQAHALNEASHDLSAITINIQNTTKNSQEMSRLAQEVTNSSKAGHKLAQQTADAMTNINEKVNAINEAISIIDQISFQTNILSLNAAVEAATAGEAGKGFAVVAGEVRNLANRSADAAKEIKDLVEVATAQTELGNNITNSMINGFQALNENISATTNLIQSVTQESNEQRLKIEQINETITKIDASTQENANIASETNIVAQQASDIAQKIVEDAGGKVFDGKENIHIRKKIIDPDYSGNEKRRIERELKANKNK